MKILKLKYGTMVYTIAFLMLISFSSCKKLIEVSPPNSSLVGESVYTNDNTAASVLTGLYQTMSFGGIMGGSTSISVQAGLSSDELSLFAGATGINQQLYQNNLSSQEQPGPWIECYGYLQTVNSVLEGISTSKTLSTTVKEQLEGEAKFIRAFCYFYLVNLYGDVPLITTSNWKINSGIAKTPKEQVWAQIIEDLKDAQNLLSENYLDAGLHNVSQDRVRPTKWAAIALLSRSYLYLQEWTNAATMASKVISNSSEFNLDSLNGVFLKNSTEAIWQLMPNTPGSNTTIDAPYFILTGEPSSNQPVYLSSSLMKSFETGDKRRLEWIDSISVGRNTYYYPFKYKSYVFGSPLTEYTMVLRLAELYLIRSEAEAEGANGGLNAAVADLNIIRNRAGLNDYSGPIEKDSVLNAIMHERKIELFTEWGNRWLDLKRTGTVDAVMSIITPQKANGAPWRSYQQLYPIFYKDILLDPNLKQNPGY